MKNMLWALIALIGFSTVSCESDDPEPVNEEEVITTLTYTLTPQGGGEAVVFRFIDIDGDGGIDPVITNDTLDTNTVYTAEITLLNQLESPAENITEEIEEEADEHQFFFISTLSNTAIDYADQDSQSNPIGLSTTVTTGAAESGDVTIILRHEPSKSAAGVSDGDITNAGGETDIEVSFQVVVQ